MRIEIPREVERLGPIMFHDVQKVFELDAGMKYAKNEKEKENQIIKRISYESLQEIQEQMAIVVPVRNERIKLIEGVLCGIPHHCLVIVVSNSPREPIDRYKMEKDALEHMCRFMQKNIIIVHQKDKTIAKACEAAGYNFFLDEEGKIKNGKAEGMILGTMLAFLSGKKYIGFIDSDNYFPGAVHEYVQEYSAGFKIAKSNFSMVRIAWHSKPKVVEQSLFFAKRGRASEHTNKILNTLVSSYTGYGTEIIKTGNAGEHAMSIELAQRLDFSSGYSIEPYHFINMFEKYAGIIKNPGKGIMKERIEIFQIESRNPHLHEVKGDEHVSEMSREALEVIYRSPVCPEELKEEIMQDLYNRNIIPKDTPLGESISYYPAIQNCNLKKLACELGNEEYAGHLKYDFKNYKKDMDVQGLAREVPTEIKDNIVKKEGKLEAK